MKLKTLLNNLTLNFIGGGKLPLSIFSKSIVDANKEIEIKIDNIDNNNDNAFKSFLIDDFIFPDLLVVAIADENNKLYFIENVQQLKELEEHLSEVLNGRTNFSGINVTSLYKYTGNTIEEISSVTIELTYALDNQNNITLKPWSSFNQHQRVEFVKVDTQDLVSNGGIIPDKYADYGTFVVLSL